MFDVRDGALFELREGKPNLKVSTAFEIDRIVCDSTKLLWALDYWALDIDDQVVRFRIEPKDFLVITTVGLERSFAFAGLFIWNVGALVRFLRQNIPAMEPVVVSDLRGDENDFKEGANRRFRRAFEQAVLQSHGAA
jgi:hypothetical protein